MLTVMAKLMKQELASDAEEEGLVPALSGRFTSMRKVPSLSDLSDPESSLGEFFLFSHSLETFTGKLEITWPGWKNRQLSSSVDEGSCSLRSRPCGLIWIFN